MRKRRAVCGTFYYRFYLSDCDTPFARESTRLFCVAKGTLYHWCMFVVFWYCMYHQGLSRLLRQWSLDEASIWQIILHGGFCATASTRPGSTHLIFTWSSIPSVYIPGNPPIYLDGQIYWASRGFTWLRFLSFDVVKENRTIALSLSSRDHGDDKQKDMQTECTWWSMRMLDCVMDECYCVILRPSAQSILCSHDVAFSTIFMTKISVSLPKAYCMF